MSVTNPEPEFGLTEWHTISSNNRHAIRISILRW